MEELFDLQTIIFIGACLAFVVIINIINFFHNARRKRYRPEIPETAHRFRMLYMTQPRFHSLIPKPIYSGWGILSIEADELVFEGEQSSGEAISLKFPKTKSAISAVTQPPWSLKALTWLQLSDEHNENFYFTPETGLFIAGSRKKGIYIYQQLMTAI